MYKYNKKTGEIIEYTEDTIYSYGFTTGFKNLKELNEWIEQLDKQPKLNNFAHGLHPSNGTWKNFLERRCKFNFEYHGYKIYNATNCWYLLEKDGNIIDDIFGYHVWSVLQNLTGQPIGDIRDKFDTQEEFFGELKRNGYLI